MPKFNYRAKDNQGKEYSGVIEAGDKEQAGIKLSQLGFYVDFVAEVIVTPKFKFPRLFMPGRINKLDLAVFAHQFSAMISSGLPLVKCLLVLSQEAENKTLRAAIDKIIFDIQSGVSLSDALKKHPQVFSGFFVSLVKSGEAGGMLPAVLKGLAKHLEKEVELKQKLTSAFTYPSAVMVVAAVVISFLLIFIVPVFQKAYKSLKVTLPLPTLLLVNTSNFMIKYWWLILLFAISVWVAFQQVVKRNKKAGFLWDYFKFYVPVFGRLNRKVATTRFCRNLAALLASGVMLGRALEISGAVLGNQVTSSIIRLMQKNINQGRSLSEALQKQRIFSALAVQMVIAGEESGRLDEMLNKTADFLDDEIEHIVKRLMNRVEPLLTLGLATVVGYIALAIYLPMFDIIRSLTERG